MSIDLNTLSREDLRAVEDLAHQRALAYRRAVYRANPERVMRTRQRSAANLLRRAGWLLLDGTKLPPPPWTADVICAVTAALEQQQAEGGKRDA